MAKSKKPKGTSRAVRRVAVVETRTGSATSTVLKSRLLRHEALAKEREESQRRLQQAFSGLSGRTVEQLRDLHPRAGPSTQPAHSEDIEPSYTDLQDVGDAMEVDGWVDDDEEEQGGDVLHALRDFLGERWKYSKYQGTRSWRQRLERADELWTAVLDEITDAYMRWRYPSAGSLGSHSDNPPLCPLRGRAHPATTPQPSRTPSGLHTQGPNGEEDDVRPSGSNIPRSTDVAGDPSAVAPEDAEGGDLSDAQKRDGTFDFTIDVVDMYSLARQAHVPRDASQTTVIALAEQGYLATSPASPSLAITFNTLEHFRLLRLPLGPFID
ncbi:hypothetical protein BN946_scf185016.g43 [Trametes cinnabarina]|uniref:Uncharacterized protein n=1 Tax=Pycnoporus cinnabarinus TaxID=5643 RepID=A0A060SI94_PYCCI|nr:hypothetical protein BN946_scf185016.g43 [Trametes cinnabarina]